MEGKKAGKRVIVKIGFIKRNTGIRVDKTPFIKWTKQVVDRHKEG